MKSTIFLSLIVAALWASTSQVGAQTTWTTQPEMHTPPASFVVIPHTANNQLQLLEQRLQQQRQHQLMEESRQREIDAIEQRNLITITGCHLYTAACRN